MNRFFCRFTLHKLKQNGWQRSLLSPAPGCPACRRSLPRTMSRTDLDGAAVFHYEPRRAGTAAPEPMPRDG
jgi:hypothetical protein